MFTVRLVLLTHFFYRKMSYNFIYFIMYSIVIRSFLIHTSQGISQRNLEKIPYIIGFGGNPDFDTIVEFPTVSLTFCYSLPLIRSIIFFFDSLIFSICLHADWSKECYDFHCFHSKLKIITLLFYWPISMQNADRYVVNRSKSHRVNSCWKKLV